MGYPIYINQDMPAVAANSQSVLFGDFSKYKIRRVLQAQMIRLNERFIDTLEIGLVVFQRFDGRLVDAGMHPVKYLVQASV